MGETLTRDDLERTILDLQEQLDNARELLAADEAINGLLGNPEELFNCRLAAKFGFHCVDDFVRDLSEDELRRWKALAILDGWFADPVVPQSESEPTPQAPPRRDGMMTPEEALKHFQGT